MKANALIDFVNARIEANKALENDATARLTNAQSTDEAIEAKAAQTKYATKQKYLSMLVKSEETVTALVSARVTESQLSAVETDSYMLAKLAYLAQALKFSRPVNMGEDDALAQALTALAESGFKSVDADALRKRLMGKKSGYTEAHTTTRQSYMILNLLSRLNVAVKQADKTFTFDINHGIVKKLSTIYAQQS